MDVPHLLVFGLGYTGAAIAREAAGLGWRVTGTSRDSAKTVPAGVQLVSFEQASRALADATHVVQTAPPGTGGDPVLAQHTLADAPCLAWAGYLSTTGVYGDRGGAWVDEATTPMPAPGRSSRRLEAEAAWRAAMQGRALDLFRVAGIYGPGRSAFDDLRAGRARRVDKPGHLFGRVHRDDIAAAVLAAAQRHDPGAVRVLNLSDDEPASSADVVAEAARLLDVPPPPLLPFEVVEPGLSEMAQSFWSENRRVSSVATQAALELRWRFPTYREGLRAILQQERAEDAA